MYLTYSTTLMPFNIHLIISSYLCLKLFDTGLLIQHLHAPFAHYVPHPFQSPYSLQWINHEAYHHAAFPSTHTTPLDLTEKQVMIFSNLHAQTQGIMFLTWMTMNIQALHIYIYIYITKFLWGKVKDIKKLHINFSNRLYDCMKTIIIHSTQYLSNV